MQLVELLHLLIKQRPQDAVNLYVQTAPVRSLFSAQHTVFVVCCQIGAHRFRTHSRCGGSVPRPEAGACLSYLRVGIIARTGLHGMLTAPINCLCLLQPPSTLAFLLPGSSAV